MTTQAVSRSLLVTLLMVLVTGCGQAPLVASLAAVAPASAAQQLRKTPLHPDVEIALRLQRALHQAPKVPEWQFAYEIGEVYQTPIPQVWSFVMVETKTDLTTGQTARRRVWGQFHAEKMLVKETKTAAL